MSPNILILTMTKERPNDDYDLWNELGYKMKCTIHDVLKCKIYIINVQYSTPSHGPIPITKGALKKMQ